MPEHLRRTSDALVWISVAKMTLPLSIGPVVFRAADAVTGVQARPVGGVPPVTLAFERPLEWILANKPLDRVLHLIVTSFSDTTKTIPLDVVAPPGLTVDSLPESVTLAPREQLDIFLRLRGTAKRGIHPFGIIGKDGGTGTRLASGFRTIQYPHLPPIRVYHSSGVWLAAVDAEIPKRLRVGYVAGAGDAVASHLFRLGIPTSLIEPDALPMVDLTQFSTIVIGVRAYETHRSLIAHNSRLLDFVRKGGTMVVQPGQSAIAALGVFPYPMTMAAPIAPVRVTDPAAPVRVTNPASKLATWPSRLIDDDWKGWLTGRADYLPTAIDPHYATMFEMHDAGEAENHNAVVVTRLGKGAYVYTSLSLHRQIPNGVIGSMRVLINLLSAGIEPGRSAARTR